jgi:hypothetical protein
MTYTLKACGSIAEIGQDNWDLCANPFLADPACGIPFDPFVSYAFLQALEESESVCPRTGWAPYHVALEEEDKGMLGVVPMYLKSHSQGEYVFDHHWADAFERAGGQYYPKLQVSVPFTPATGRRLLTSVTPGTDPGEIENLLLGGVMKMAENLETSSVHITFADKMQWEHMGELGFLQRTHKQFHWQNNGYDSFDEFLSELSSKKRKNIKRERMDHRFRHKGTPLGRLLPVLYGHWFQEMGPALPESVVLFTNWPIDASGCPAHYVQAGRPLYCRRH